MEASLGIVQDIYFEGDSFFRFVFFYIGLFKILSRWMSRIFNDQIQSKRGLTLINLCFKIKTKTYLVFISMVEIHSVCHC